jgi:hypothetical protein
MKKIYFFITDLVVRLFLHRLAAFYSPLKFFKVQLRKIPNGRYMCVFVLRYFY